MNKLTFFIITRKIFESPIWKDDPHILKLFIYLVGNARHSKNPKRYPNFEIKRGELVSSLSDIAENNEYFQNGALKKWSRQKVSRMLEKLVKYNQIILKTDTYGTHVEIVNYNIYQDISTYKTDRSVTGVEQVCYEGVTGVGTNNNDINDINENKEKKEEPPTFFKKDGTEYLIEEKHYTGFKQKFPKYSREQVEHEILKAMDHNNERVQKKRVTNVLNFINNWLERVNPDPNYQIPAFKPYKVPDSPKDDEPVELGDGKFEVMFREQQEKLKNNKEK